MLVSGCKDGGAVLGREADRVESDGIPIAGITRFP